MRIPERSQNSADLYDVCMYECVYSHVGVSVSVCRGTGRCQCRNSRGMGRVSCDLHTRWGMRKRGRSIEGEKKEGRPATSDLRLLSDAPCLRYRGDGDTAGASQSLSREGLPFVLTSSLTSFHLLLSVRLALSSKKFRP